jgi:hypothetical protein
LGELVDEAGSRPKGMSNYLLDLRGKNLYARNKTDIPQREENLEFLFRAMGRIRMEFGVSTDLVLQVEVYRAMLYEQEDARAEDRHAAFILCGLISRIHRLQFFTKIGKLKLFVVGSVLKLGTADTLSLEDFITTERITSKPTTCPNNNAGLVAALKNIQTMLQIVFSDACGKFFDPFTEKLEGAVRPMELVPSDLLKHSVELRKVFRAIRSVKSASMPYLDLEGPGRCAKFFTDSFENLPATYRIMPQWPSRTSFTESRRLDSLRVLQERRQSVSRENQLNRQSVSRSLRRKIKEQEQPKFALDTWGKDGRPYVCGFSKNSIFVHMSIAGESDQKLLEVAAAMPPPMKKDIVRAINIKK